MCERHTTFQDEKKSLLAGLSASWVCLSILARSFFSSAEPYLLQPRV